MKIRVGVGLASTAAAGLDTDGFWAIIDGCESGGWDSIWFSERVSGPGPGPLAAMAAVAGRTRRLKFGPSVMVLPGRNPVLLAKELATIDVLSGGRLVVAFGLGAPAPDESAVFGSPRAERAARTDEATALIKRLWTEDAVTHAGPHFTVDALTLRPRPVQQPHPDVWFGGHSAAAARRVGRLGDGWLPSFIAAAEYGPKADLVRRTAAEHGREIDREHFGALVPYVPEGTPAEPVLALVAARRPDVDPEQIVVTGTADDLRTRLEAFVEQGASKFVVTPVAPPRDWPAELARMRDAVARPLEN